MEILRKLWSTLNIPYEPAVVSSLDTMDLGPRRNTDNPVMVSFRSGGVLGQESTRCTDPILHLGLQTSRNDLVELF